MVATTEGDSRRARFASRGGACVWKTRVVREKPAISIDKLARMLLGAEANAAEALEQQMLSRLDGQTLVGGKHVARQQLPDLLLGQGERALVLSTHGGVEQAP